MNNNNHPDGDNNFNVTCVLRETSEDEVKKILRFFEGKRYHREEIQPSILAKVSAPVLSNIFKQCILSCVNPDILKRAHVVPIFKSGESSMTSNYRPI